MEKEECIEAMHVLVNKSQCMHSTLQDKKKRLELSLKSQWMKSDLDIQDLSAAKRGREEKIEGGVNYLLITFNLFKR